MAAGAKDGGGEGSPAAGGIGETVGWQWPFPVARALESRKRWAVV